MWERFSTSLLVMGLGMLGIFVAILVIVIAVKIMSKVSAMIENRGKKKEEE